jgi:hypothetical protein
MRRLHGRACLTVEPLHPQGLTATGIASLVAFAVQADIAIEFGATGDSSLYAATGSAAGFGKALDTAAWVVSREAGQVVAYGEQQEVVRSFGTVGAALGALADLLRTPVHRVG